MTSKLASPRRAIVALAVVAMAMAAAPAAQAHDPGQGRQFDRHNEMRGDARGPDRAMRGEGRGPAMGMRGGPGRPGMLLAFSCAPRAAEGLEINLVRLSHRLDLTDTQQPLFDAFRTSALTAQTGLIDECQSLRPAAATETTPADPVQSIRDRLSVESARIAAVESVLPDYEALITSLSDEQSALLAPRARERVGDMRSERGGNRGGWQRHQGPRHQMPAAPQPPAPSAPATAPQG